MPILLFTFLSLFLLHTPVWAEHQGTVPIQREGLWYYPDHDEPVNGSVVEWHENGQKKSEGTFKEGKKDGSFTSWHENGQKQREGIVKEGKEDGLWREWHQNGSKAGERTYKDGQMNGLWIGWYQNGQKSVEGLYKDGKLKSPLREWWGNGQKSSIITLIDGNGQWISWHINGQQKRELNYKNGKLNGRSIEWHKNGQKKEEGNYKDGKKDGIWRKWDRRGGIIKQIIYDKGTKVSETIHKEEGFGDVYIDKTPHFAASCKVAESHAYRKHVDIIAYTSDEKWKTDERFHSTWKFVYSGGKYVLIDDRESIVVYKLPGVLFVMGNTITPSMWIYAIHLGMQKIVASQVATFGGLESMIQDIKARSINLTCKFALHTNQPPSFTSDFGEIIKQAQKQLQTFQLYYGAVDGEMNEKTTSALKLFQLTNGLPTTGELDTETRKALGIE